MKKAVYAGSFDPITKGHEWMIREGSKLFDKLIVSIGKNPSKKSTFSLDEKLEMIKKSTKDLSNVEIDDFEHKFLVNYAESKNASHILRGIRSENDYGYEKGMRNINGDLKPGITSIFLMPPRELGEISSSLVKGLVGPEEWEEVIERYISRDVYNRFLVKFNGLENKFKDSWKNIGAKTTGEQEYKELLDLYGQPHRAYHNFVHIAHTLREIEKVSEHLRNPELTKIATWYHDAIYNTERTDNEEKSKELAEKRMYKAGIEKPVINKINSMVLTTNPNKVPKTNDATFLSDADIAILGKPPEIFDVYEKDIRFEYNRVPEETFRKKRKDVLQIFLNRDNIYSTDYFWKKYEKKARENLKKSIGNLS